MAARDEFEDLVERYSRVMSAAIWRVCGKRHALHVPDIQQEVSLALWKRLQDGKRIQNPVSYLYKMALTTALAVVRRVGREEGDAPERGDLREGPRPVGTTLLPAEQLRLVEQTLAQLEPDQGRALRAYLMGFNHVEVARLFGWTESVARHHIYRGLGVLRRRAGAKTDAIA